MSFIKFALAAGSLMPAILAAPMEKRATDAYKMYAGDGTVTWPAQSNWVSSVDDMFTSNMNTLKTSCTQWNVPNNSDQEISDIKSGIATVSKETGVDARFIFAIMMQESNGCVRAPTTNYGVRNPGLMQDHDGAATCNEGTVQNPCPATTITQMIRDGVAGTKAGDGLVQTLAQAGTSDSSKYYRAARIYNSGSIDKSGNLNAGIATHCYATDIANRLTGWATAQSACTQSNAASAPVPPTSASSSAPSAASPSASTFPGLDAAPAAPAASSAAPAPVSSPSVAPAPAAPAAPSVAPAPAPVAPAASGSGSCPVDGAVVCSADGTQFGLCNFGHAVMMPVAAGTTCSNGMIH